MDSPLGLARAISRPDNRDFRLVWPTNSSLLTGGHCILFFLPNHFKTLLSGKRTSNPTDFELSSGKMIENNNSEKMADDSSLEQNSVVEEKDNKNDYDSFLAF